MGIDIDMDLSRHWLSLFLPPLLAFHIGILAFGRVTVVPEIQARVR